MKNQDALERFVQENRAAFDDAVPSLDIWAAIDRDLPREAKVRKMPILRLMRIAAAVVVLLVVGGIGGAYLSNNSSPNDATTIIAAVSPELKEMEGYYENQINDRYQQLVKYDANPTVKEDLDQIDEAMRELREELVDAPKGSEEMIIENLIRSYQSKIDILERVLERVKDKKGTKLKTESNAISI